MGVWLVSMTSGFTQTVYWMEWFTYCTPSDATKSGESPTLHQDNLLGAEEWLSQWGEDKNHQQKPHNLLPSSVLYVRERGGKRLY